MNGSNGLRARLTKTVRRSRRSSRRIVRWAAAFFDASTRAVRFCTSGSFRSVELLRLLDRGQVHQTSSLTATNRYPRIFSTCKDYFGDREGLRILSFGCSTGEEVLALRQYFPTATITGTDVNKRSLAVCRKLTVDDRISFVYSDPEAIARRGPYDAIFCMAVLQRTPMTVKARGVTSLEAIYPFERFDRQVSELDGMLTRGGLLVVHHTHYRISDATVAHLYEPLDEPSWHAAGPDTFDRGSRRIEGEIPRSSIFVKVADDRS